MLRNTLSKHLNEIESIYKEDELLQEAAAAESEDEYQAEQGKVKYLINRRYVYMTAGEYTAYMEKEKSECNKVYERLGICPPT